MRRFALALLFVLAAVSAPPVSMAAERIAVPFTCENQGGRVTVQPSALKSYRILGKREQRPLPICDSADARDCRIVMVHSFAISCGGVRTPWIEVAAAASVLGTTRAWVEDGSLNIVLKSRQPPGAAATASDCLEAPARLMGPSATVGLGGFKCPLRRSEGTRHVVLPAGFAPLGEVGGRLVIEPEHASSPAADAHPMETGSTSVESPAAGRVHLAAMGAQPGVASDAAGDVAGRTVLAAAESAQGWEAVTTVERQTEKAAGKQKRSWRKIALMVFGVVLLVAGLWVVAMLRPELARAAYRHLRVDAWGTVIPRISERLGYARAQEPRLANAALSVISLLTQTERAVHGLPPVPLRDVLEQEIEAVRQRFAALRAATPDPDGQDAKAAGRYRLIIRELERIQRIADSAAVSQSARRSSVRLPRTKAEAYQLLGVNPDVSESIAKKLVDALRMNWHPDHAKDDADRCQREDRIKEINIAWELINGKRTAT